MSDIRITKPKNRNVADVDPFDEYSSCVSSEGAQQVGGHKPYPEALHWTQTRHPTNTLHCQALHNNFHQHHKCNNHHNHSTAQTNENSTSKLNKKNALSYPETGDSLYEGEVIHNFNNENHNIINHSSKIDLTNDVDNHVNKNDLKLDLSSFGKSIPELFDDTIIPPDEWSPRSRDLLLQHIRSGGTKRKVDSWDEESACKGRRKEVAPERLSQDAGHKAKVGLISLKYFLANFNNSQINKFFLVRY